MKGPGIQFWCEDEVHFPPHSSLMQMWAAKGQQPCMLSASTRQSMGFFGAENLKTGCLLTKEVSTEELQMTLTSHFAKWEQPNSVLKVLCAGI